MKKVLIVLTLALAIIFSGIGMVEALEPVEGCTLVEEITYDGTPYSGTVDSSDGDVWPILCAINMVNRMANILFTLIVVLVVFFVIAGGFFILTGGQKEENIAKGKKFITFAIIGTLVAIFAAAVPTLIGFFVG